MDKTFCNGCMHYRSVIDHYTTDESPVSEDGTSIRTVGMCFHPSLADAYAKNKIIMSFKNEDCPRMKIKYVTKCMLCDQDIEYSEKETDNIDFHAIRICSECREAFLHYKNKYYGEKLLHETTELDQEVFAETCKQIGLDETLDDNMQGMFPMNCEESITELVPFLKKTFKNNKWFNEQDGRMDAFCEYIENYIRKYYKEKGAK